jgi:hypothetical protein
MVDVKFNIKGRITIGSDANKSIIVQDDTQGSTGGYYIYTTDDLVKDSPIYDDWYETIEPVKKFIEEYGVIWLEN